MARSWTKVRSEIANEKRHNPDADTTELHRELKAARLAAHIREVVDSAPPLNEQQRAELAGLLVGNVA